MELELVEAVEELVEKIALSGTFGESYAILHPAPMRKCD